MVAGPSVGGLLAATQAALFKVTFDAFLPFLFRRFFFLAEGFLDGAVALLVKKFVEIVGFAFEAGFWAAGGGFVASFCVVAAGFAMAASGLALGGSRGSRWFHADNLLFYNSNE